MIGLLPLLAALALAGPAPAPAPAAPPLALIRTFPIGGEGGWDYLNLDPAGGRIYLPRSTRVMVLDLEGRPVGEVPGTPGVHGVALAPELDRGWTSNGGSGTVTVFRLSSLEVLDTVPSGGGNPDAILYEPCTRRVFVCNGRGRNATVLDAASSAPLGSIDLGGKPEFAACDGRGRVFINNQDKAEINVIDARTLRVQARWPVAPLERPTGLAMDAAGNRLFSVAGNRLMAVVDAGSGKVLATLPIGGHCDGVAFDPGTGCAYAANGEGTVTVVRPDAAGHYAVAATVATRPGARTLVADPRTHRLYLPDADSGPAASPGERPAILPGTFRLLVLGAPDCREP